MEHAKNVGENYFKSENAPLIREECATIPQLQQCSGSLFTNGDIHTASHTSWKLKENIKQTDDSRHL